MNDAIVRQLENLPNYLSGHIELTLTALAIGTVLSVSLGIIVSRVPWLQTPVVGTVSVIQTVPGLALLAIMVPLLGRIGFLPALVALTLYSMLPILRNTVIGICEVDAAVVEAARGVGMSENQMLRTVQLPLAAPVIVGGIRTAAVWTVGTATLATPIGATSLGNYIFNGLQTRNNTALIVGCVSAALLAILLDGCLRGLEFGVQRRSRKWVVAMIAIFAVTAAGASVKRVRKWFDTDQSTTVVIGAKPFTEQIILGQLIAQHVHARLGLDTEVKESLGSTIAFDALVSNQIDVYVDYSGTVWTNILKRDTGAIDRRTMISVIADELHREYEIEVIGSLGFENAYCLAMRRAEAARLGIKTISDLRARSRSLTFGTDMAFQGRAEYTALTDVHDVRFGEYKTMDPVLMYEAVAQGNVDVITAYTTEGRITAFDLVVLNDDLDVFPPYDAIILVSPQTADQNRTLIDALGLLRSTIDNESMTHANWSVDEGTQSPTEAAAELLDAINDSRKSGLPDAPTDP